MLHFGINSASLVSPSSWNFPHELPQFNSSETTGTPTQQFSYIPKHFLLIVSVMGSKTNGQDVSKSQSTTPPCAIDDLESSFKKLKPCAASFDVQDLTNPIHAIFRIENFVDPRIDVTAIMQPALRLASRFITTDQLLPFWHTVFFSEVKPTKPLFYPQTSLSKSYVYTEDHVELTQDQIRRTKKALEDFKDKVVFDLLPPEWCCSITKVESKNAIPVFLRRGCNKIVKTTGGIRSRIRIGSSGYEWVCVSRTAGDWEWYIRALFLMAKTLVHELAHAVVLVERGNHRCFFPNSTVAEDGFDWETRVLGGYIINEVSEKYEGLVCFGWPNPSTVNSYMARGTCMGVREESERKTEHGWDVPFSYCEQFFTTSFWESEVPLRGREAFFTRPETVYELEPDGHGGFSNQRAMQRDEWFPLYGEPMGAKP